MSNPAMMQAQSSRVQGRNRAAIWTLLVLSPVIGEVLSGSTRLSVLFVLIPEIMVWGAGAMLARELVRRWRGGMPSLLMLGMALAVGEEFLIQQTSLAPLPFPGVNADYGRFLGVNWIYFLFMLLYESLWVVLVPVQVTELLFPERRHAPWLRKRGLIVTCIAFLLGCRIAWYGWTQQALPRMGVAPYHAPLLTISAGVAAILALVWLAYALREAGHGPVRGNNRPGSPWFGGIAACVMGFGWWALMILIFSPRPPVGAALALGLGLGWAVLAFFLFSRLSASSQWNDRHRWAISAGATLACMTPSYLSTAGWTRADLVFKIIANIAAVLGLIQLRRMVWRRETATNLADSATALEE